MLKGLNLKCNIHTKRAMKTWQRNEGRKEEKFARFAFFSPLKCLSDRSTSFLNEREKRSVLVMHARHVK